MDDWEDSIRGPGGIRYGVWIPRDPNYVKKQEPKAPEPPKAPANDWIKIKMVDDQSGEVIPKVVLNLKTPDNSTEQHETRLSGMIESLGLQSSNCEVSCDLKDATIENTLSFVGIGEKPIGQKNANESNSKDDTGYKPGNKYIASIEEHKVKTGETLKSVADSAGMSWQALAKFNWGTDDPDEINKHLFNDVGCTKKPQTEKTFYLTIRIHLALFLFPKN
jgi:LysM repeat protein